MSNPDQNAYVQDLAYQLDKALADNGNLAKSYIKQEAEMIHLRGLHRKAVAAIKRLVKKQDAFWSAHQTAIDRVAKVTYERNAKSDEAERLRACMGDMPIALLKAEQEVERLRAELDNAERRAKTAAAQTCELIEENQRLRAADHSSDEGTRQCFCNSYPHLPGCAQASSKIGALLSEIGHLRSILLDSEPRDCGCFGIECHHADAWIAEYEKLQAEGKKP